MSVLWADRTKSRWEVGYHAEQLHDMLREFMIRDFGIKDLRHYAQLRYAYGQDETENYGKYLFMIFNHKKNLDFAATMLTSNLRAANTIRPTSLHELEIRRDYQNYALVNCEQMQKELMKIVETFELDINAFKPYVQAIDHESDLIKGWRSQDKKRYESRLSRGSI